MDKELIERIIEESYEKVMSQTLRPSDKQYVIATVEEALSRIDAERGREAHAWSFEFATMYDSKNDEYGGWSKRLSDTKPNAGRGMRNLVALSPTIPEGMALVPANSTEASLQAKVAAQSALIERLKTVPMKYRRMAFNAQLQEENARQAVLISALWEAISPIRWCKGFPAEVDKVKVLAAVEAFRQYQKSFPPKATDLRDAYQQVDDFSAGNYKGI